MSFLPPWVLSPPLPAKHLPGPLDRARLLGEIWRARCSGTLNLAGVPVSVKGGAVDPRSLGHVELGLAGGPMAFVQSAQRGARHSPLPLGRMAFHALRDAAPRRDAAELEVYALEGSRHGAVLAVLDLPEPDETVIADSVLRGTSLGELGASPQVLASTWALVQLDVVAARAAGSAVRWA